MVYDSRRDRLLQLTGVAHYGFRGATKLHAKIYAYPLKTGKWELLKTEGESALSRDVDYNAKHDTLMVLGDRKWLMLDLASNICFQDANPPPNILQFTARL